MFGYFEWFQCFVFFRNRADILKHTKRTKRG